MAKVISPGKTKKKRRPPNKVSVIMSVANALLLAAVIILSVPLAVPRAFGYQPYTVVSGSMEPAIPVGSLVYVKNCGPEEIAVSDVAAFYKNGDPGTIIIHRVMENDEVSGLLTTKGDANADVDFEPVPYSSCIGVVAKSFAGLGGLADALTSKSGKAALFCVVAVIAASQALANWIDRRSRRTASNDKKEATA